MFHGDILYRRCLDTTSPDLLLVGHRTSALLSCKISIISQLLGTSVSSVLKNACVADCFGPASTALRADIVVFVTTVSVGIALPPS